MLVITKLNWIKIHDDMERLFESWKKRKLTIFGKTCIIISELIYVGLVLPIPEEIKSSSFNFIWDKRDRIKRHTIIGNVEDGGIGLVDVELKLKASWTKRLVDQSCILNRIVNGYLEKINIDVNYLLTLTERKIKDFIIISSLPTFYKEVFCCLNECKRKTEISHLSSANFTQQPLWNNEIIEYQEKSIGFKNGIDSHILYVKDLFNYDGELKKLHDFSNV